MTEPKCAAGACSEPGTHLCSWQFESFGIDFALCGMHQSMIALEWMPLLRNLSQGETVDGGEEAEAQVQREED